MFLLQWSFQNCGCFRLHYGEKVVYRVSTYSHSQKGLEAARTKGPVYTVYVEWKAGSTSGHLPDRYPTEPCRLPWVYNCVFTSVSVNARAPHAERWWLLRSVRDESSWTSLFSISFSFHWYCFNISIRIQLVLKLVQQNLFILKIYFCFNVFLPIVCVCHWSTGVPGGECRTPGFCSYEQLWTTWCDCSELNTSPLQELQTLLTLSRLSSAVHIFWITEVTVNNALR